MVAMSSLVQVNIGVAAVSIAYCFHEAKKLQVFGSLVSPSTIVNQPANIRLAVAAAGGSTLFLGLSLLEQAFFSEDSTGKTISLAFWPPLLVPVVHYVPDFVLRNKT